MSEKRERCNNFSFEEDEILVSLVEEKKSILECKQTDTISNKCKALEWEKLAAKFNSQSNVVRTSKMLRSKWESLKKHPRKEVADVRTYRLKTGGGPSKKSKTNPWADRIICILGIGATGTSNIFDSDYDADDVPEEAETTKDDSILEMHIDDIPVVSDAEAEGSDSIVLEMDAEQWAAWNPASLRQPVTKALRVDTAINSENSEEGPNNNEILQENFKRRRPILNKRRKNNSPAVETNLKFATLADRKLQLIELEMELAEKESEARMKMEAERHELQIKILEAELKLKEKLLK